MPPDPDFVSAPCRWGTSPPSRSLRCIRQGGRLHCALQTSQRPPWLPRRFLWYRPTLPGRGRVPASRTGPTPHGTPQRRLSGRQRGAALPVSQVQAAPPALPSAPSTRGARPTQDSDAQSQHVLSPALGETPPRHGLARPPPCPPTTPR